MADGEGGGVNAILSHTQTSLQSPANNGKIHTANMRQEQTFTLSSILMKLLILKLKSVR